MTKVTIGVYSEWAHNGYGGYEYTDHYFNKKENIDKFIKEKEKEENDYWRQIRDEEELDNYKIKVKIEEIKTED